MNEKERNKEVEGNKSWVEESETGSGWKEMTEEGGKERTVTFLNETGN